MTLSLFPMSFAAGLLRRWLAFPPGPPGIPLVGNALQLPLERQWVTYESWAREYGDIVHVSSFGQHIILLNSETAVLDLLERRSAIYSDRPELCMSGVLVGWGDSVPMCAYGPRHREYRKLLNEVLAPRKLEEYHAMEEERAREYLRLLIKDPTSFTAHSRWFVSAIVFDLSHGYTLAERANLDFSLSALPGAYLCDLLPISALSSNIPWGLTATDAVRHIPDWTGVRFKRDAKRFRKTVETLRDRPYNDIKAQVSQGTARPSLTASLVERNPNPTPDEELTLKWASLGLYGGSGQADTSSVLESFFLAMSLYPDVQAQAYAELLDMVGTKRLPGFSDRAHLPYISAVIKEVLRWNPVTPLALPHRLIQDDIYRGYYIPACSVIFANSWAIMHDPAVYPAPFEFNPARFLKQSSSDDLNLNPDPHLYAFGFGRRLCPGQFLAEDGLFIVIFTTLAVFRITPVDKTARNVEYTSGIISHPKALECIFTPRSEEAVSLV
ncbi:cytochrome P450 [Mycena latifolia]|nr:cytochrome P450 [Mycena latifolia]